MSKGNRFLYSFIGLVIFQIFMSMEEIIGHFPKWIPLLTEKIHLRMQSFPVIHINEQIFMFMSLIIIVILFVFLAFVFIESSWSRILAIILGIIEIINGGLHIVTSLYFMRYIPGSISAVGVIFFGFLIIYISPYVQKGDTEEA